MKHELVQLAGKIDWAWTVSQITPLYQVVEKVIVAGCRK